MTETLYEYLVAHSTPLAEVDRELIAETRDRLPDRAVMQVGAEQAGLLTLLTRLLGARQAVEVGTFTGLSALAIARGLAPDGRLTCFDISTEFTDLARRHWERAGVADRIELRIGDATAGLAELPDQPHLDLAFIDADKPNYLTYWSLLVPRVRPGGLLVVDNVLWSGRVLAPEPDDVNGQALVRFNDEVVKDPRVELVMLPVGDGLTLAYRR